METLLKEQHAANGLFVHREEIIIFMSFTAAATESCECSICSSGGNVCVFFISFLTQHWAGHRLAEPLHGHLNMNAAAETCQQPQWWENWLGTSLILSTVDYLFSCPAPTERYIANLKKNWQVFFLRAEGACWCRTLRGSSSSAKEVMLSSPFVCLFAS